MPVLYIATISCLISINLTWWYIILMGWCKNDVTPLLTPWSYVFLALTHRYKLQIFTTKKHGWIIACCLVWWHEMWSYSINNISDIITGCYSMSCYTVLVWLVLSFVKYYRANGVLIFINIACLWPMWWDRRQGMWHNLGLDCSRVGGTQPISFVCYFFHFFQLMKLGLYVRYHMFDRYHCSRAVEYEHDAMNWAGTFARFHISIIRNWIN